MSSKIVHMQLLNGSKTNHQNKMMLSLQGARDQRNVSIIKTDFSHTDLHWQKTLLYFRKQQQDDNFFIHIFLELLYQNTASSTFKKDISKLEISKSRNNPSLGKQA